MAIQFGHLFQDTQLVPTMSLTAYGANQVAGGLITFNIGPGYLRGFSVRRLDVVDTTNQKPAIRFHLFAAKPANIADKGSYLTGIGTADLKFSPGFVTVATGDFQTFGNNAAAHENNLDLDIFFQPNQEAGKVWAYAELTGTPTFPGTTPLTFVLTGWGT